MPREKQLTKACFHRGIIRRAFGRQDVGIVRELHQTQRTRRAAEPRAFGAARARADGKIRDRLEQGLRFRLASEHLVQQAELERRIAGGTLRGNWLQKIFRVRVMALIGGHPRARHGRVEVGLRVRDTPEPSVRHREDGDRHRQDPDSRFLHGKTHYQPPDGLYQ